MKLIEGKAYNVTAKAGTFRRVYQGTGWCEFDNEPQAILLDPETGNEKAIAFSRILKIEEIQGIQESVETGVNNEAVRPETKEESMFKVEFKKSAKARKVMSWIRCGDDTDSMVESVKQAVVSEYGDAAVVISIRKLSLSEVNQVRSGLAVA